MDQIPPSPTMTIGASGNQVITGNYRIVLNIIGESFPEITGSGLKSCLL